MGRNQNLLFFSILGPNLLPKNQKPKLHNSSKIKQKKKQTETQLQGFPNGNKEWGRWDQKFCWGEYFHRAVGAWGGVILTIRTFFKARNRFL